MASRHGDGVTGLGTRQLAERRLDLALRNGRTPAALIVDVDAFRLAADDLPRSSADDLIRAVGQRLRTASTGDIVAATGGARYLVVTLTDTDVTRDAEAHARHLCASIARDPFVV